MNARPVAIGVFLLLGTAPSCGTAIAQREAEFEKFVLMQLAARDSQAARLFTQATALLDSGDYRGAAEGFERVRARIPGSSHATRRLSYSLLGLGERERAIQVARAAVREEFNAHNLTALARALASPTDSGPAPDAQLGEALGLTREAARRDPQDVDVHVLMVSLAMARQDGEAFMQAAQRLGAIAPGQPATHHALGLAATLQGDYGGAMREFKRARELGLPDSVYAGLMDMLDHRPRSALERTGWIAAWVIGAWLGGMLALFGLGLLLSRVTLHAAERLSSSPEGRAIGWERGLRRLYRAVIWGSCAYYFISIPLVIAVTLGAAASVIYGFLAVGHVPIKLALLVVVGALVTVWAVLRSVFLVRGRPADPGLGLDLARNAGLRCLLERVAASIETRPVDSVYLTPGTELAVMERGGMMKQLRGTSERCLLVGAGVLEGMRIGALKAVLAHEYGHFSNRDTAGGGFALAVRRSVATMAYRIAGGGAASWFNPAWWFVNGFYRVFIRISHGASRLQEILADRWAVCTYGSLAFERGLRQVIERGVRFPAHAQASLAEVVQGGQPLVNLYRYRPSSLPPEAELARVVEEAMEARPSAYDSHPAPAQRFAWARALAVPDVRGEGDDDEAWTLFEDREVLEQRMTAEVRRNVLEQTGTEIPPGEAPSTATSPAPEAG